MDNEIQNSNFLFYNTEDGKTSVQVIVDNISETIWTTQKGMSEIFGVEVPAISKHLKNIFEEGELNELSVISKKETTATDGKKYLTNFYSIDAIIAVGYRVNSYKATKFRIWATTILKEYLIKGFALDDERLKQSNKIFGKDHFKELIERIREIRASERMFYEKITDLYKECSIDYDKDAKITLDFYAEVQNKLHFAIHGHTAAELIKERADSSKTHMGLTSFKAFKTGGKIIPADVKVAKNYLSENELSELNRVVSMYLDYAENIARKGQIMKMADWIEKLDSFLKFNEYPMLKGKGKISSDLAKKFALNEYSKFRVIQDKAYKSDFNRFIDVIKSGNLPIEKSTEKIEGLSSFNKSLK